MFPWVSRGVLRSAAQRSLWHGGITIDIAFTAPAHRPIQLSRKVAILHMSISLSGFVGPACFPERAPAQGFLLVGLPPVFARLGPADFFFDKRSRIGPADCDFEDVSSETRVFEIPLDK